MKTYKELTTDEKAFLWCRLNRWEEPEIIQTSGCAGARDLMKRIVNEIGQKEVARSWHINVCGSTNAQFETWWDGGGCDSWCK